MLLLTYQPTTGHAGLWFCCRLQVWVRNGIILTCGHRSVADDGCYACTHAGTRHDPCARCH
jgi:hypothetical protein